MNAFFNALRTGRIVRSAIKVSLVVGTILNLLNQKGLVLEDGTLSWLHVAMNYVVPYCVSSYSAAINEINRIKEASNDS